VLQYENEVDLDVAIPFSSGQYSFCREFFHTVLIQWSQSLFHQVCVRSEASSMNNLYDRQVAIPFSSGLCSFPSLSGDG